MLVNPGSTQLLKLGLQLARVPSEFFEITNPLTICLPLLGSLVCMLPTESNSLRKLPWAWVTLAQLSLSGVAMELGKDRIRIPEDYINMCFQKISFPNVKIYLRKISLAVFF
jgi:hypothetical protein